MLLFLSKFLEPAIVRSPLASSPLHRLLQNITGTYFSVANGKKYMSYIHRCFTMLGKMSSKGLRPHDGRSHHRDAQWAGIYPIPISNCPWAACFTLSLQNDTWFHFFSSHSFCHSMQFLAAGYQEHAATSASSWRQWTNSCPRRRMHKPLVRTELSWWCNLWMRWPMVIQMTRTHSPRKIRWFM